MHRLNNQNGFTFIEAIVQLFILAILLQLAVYVFIWTSNMQRTYQDLHPVKWEQFVFDFQRELKDVDKIYAINANRGVMIQRNKEVITIEFKNGLLRKRVDGEGHIPLLTKVQDVQFQVNRTSVELDLIFSERLKKEREFIVEFSNE